MAIFSNPFYLKCTKCTSINSICGTGSFNSWYAVCTCHIVPGDNVADVLVCSSLTDLLRLDLEPESQPRPEPSNIKYEGSDGECLCPYWIIDTLFAFIYTSSILLQSDYNICHLFQTVHSAQCFVVNKSHWSWACCKAWIDPTRSHIISEAE